LKKDFRYLLSKLTIFIFVFSSIPAVSQGQEDLDTAINNLTETISQLMAEKEKTKIAIIPFPNLSNEITKLGSYLAEELTTNLFISGKFKIVERSLLKQVLDELKLSQMGVVDPGSAKELGKMAGVDAIVAGTIADLGSYVAVNCRLIETETGEVFAAAKAKINKVENISKMME
jgi:curli biogenesis system outer membrane secretion channel CsgG